jgi:hypothetical protein
MQEYVTRAEFNELKKQVEQQTEPINLRIERGLPVPEATLLQTIMDMVGRQGPNIAVLKTDMEGVKADIKAIRESQADFRDKLQTMATKDDVTSVKSDISRLEDDITSIKTTQEKILTLLQQKSGE